jgi:uncharacterized membrane protein YfcA
VIAAGLIGLAGGLLAGLFGVGGGILFVPALTLAGGLGQVQAEATSLVAIVPVALVGAWRQRRYGNVRLADAGLLGVLSALGAVGGVAAANVVPERALEIGFAILMLLIAAQLVRQALATRRARSD